MKKVQFIAVLALAATLAMPQLANAAVITSDLGNTLPGIIDSATPTLIEIAAIQGGEPAPFDQGYGVDLPPLFGSGSNFEKSWTHDFGPIVDPILSATITFGIIDHDSAAPGSQLALFTLDGNPRTVELDALFEAGGGSGDQEYNVYSLALPGSFFADLTDGLMMAQLNLDGPGSVPTLFPIGGSNPPTETATNGAFLIFSTLEIETDVLSVPEPGTLLLFSTFGILLGAKSLRRRRRRAL